MKTVQNMILGMMLMLVRAETKKYMDDAVSEILSEMKENLSRMHEQLASTQAELDATKTELKNTKAELSATRAEFADNNSKLASGISSTNADMVSIKNEVIVKTQELERKLSFARQPPFIHSCGSQDSISISSMVISYNTLLYSSKNTEGGGLDLTRGTFTSPWGGTYTVTWSLSVEDNSEDYYVLLYLRLNGEQIPESTHMSQYSGPSGKVLDQGKVYYTV